MWDVVVWFNSIHLPDWHWHHQTGSWHLKEGVEDRFLYH